MDHTIPFFYKRLLLSIFSFLSIHQIGMACDPCQKQQPKVLQGITHGTGPQSNWDYVIIVATALSVLWCFVYSVKYLMKPTKTSHEHFQNLFSHE